MGEEHTHSKSILLLWPYPPYGDSNSREALDLALAFGAYEQVLAILFSGDGVWNLMPDQQSSGISQKSIVQMLGALSLYGIETVYACAQSLNDRNIDTSTLTIPIELLSADGIQQIIGEHQIVLTV